jgi:hypothetical protein
MSYATGTDWGRAKKDFKQHFHVGIGGFYDGLTTIVFQKICIDILKFDDWLHAQYGNYEDRGLTMEKLIIEQYGNKALKFLEELI